MCFVRQNSGNQIVLTTYGKSSGFCIDPIEKKPLNHFFSRITSSVVWNCRVQPDLQILPELGYQSLKGV